MELSDYPPGGTTVERNRTDAPLCPGGGKRGVIAELVRNLSSPVLLLDWDLQVICQSRAVAFPGILLVDARDGASCLADCVREFCLTLKTRWLQLTGGSHRVPAASDGWEGRAVEPESGASIVLLLEDSSPGAKPLFLVQCAAKSEGQSESPRSGLLARLTACERQVAVLVGEGCTNDEVAAKLAKSALTVKKQLRSIFQKLQVTSRARLCALMHQSSMALFRPADTPNE